MLPLALALLLADPSPAFQLSWDREAPLLGSSAALFAGSLVELAVRRPTPCPCDPSALPSFDRFAVGLSSSAAGTASDFLDAALLVAAPLGIAAAAAPGGWGLVGELVLIQGESMALSASLDELVKYAVARPRPYAYPTSSRAIGDYTSFWSGHTASSFDAVVTAGYLLHESYPDAAWPWIVLAGGLAASTAVATLRVAAGKHFPSDVVVGAVAGSGIGLLVPWLHRRPWPVRISAGAGGLVVTADL
ncbi:MAG: phosphatase PAP2 family protein [Myxococcales bacterium]